MNSDPSLEIPEAQGGMLNTNNTAYLITTAALFGGILAFYFAYIRGSNQVQEQEDEREKEDEYEPVPPQDLTIEQLKYYDGTEGKPILVSVNHVVYDVTKGKNFYGPGGPYEMLAGHDGSRALAKMSLEPQDVKDGWDDLTDLTPFQLDSLNDWVMKFQTRYSEVGKLLKPEE